VFGHASPAIKSTASPINFGGHSQDIGIRKQEAFAGGRIHFASVDTGRFGAGRQSPSSRAGSAGLLTNERGI